MRKRCVNPFHYIQQSILFLFRFSWKFPTVFSFFEMYVSHKRMLNTKIKKQTYKCCSIYIFLLNIHKTVAIKYHCFPFERIFSFIILEIPKNFQKLLYGNFKKTFNGFIFMSWYLKNIMFLRDGYSMFQMTSFSTWVFFFNFSFASFIINVRFFPWKENKIKINI